MNIATRENQKDSFFRYKRERVKLQNKIITNWVILLNQLKTPEKELQTFLSKALGCRVGPKGRVGADISAEKIDECVQNYIEKHILCPNCRLPEIGPTCICQACGTKCQNGKYLK
jgi:hypothetical protein